MSNNYVGALRRGGDDHILRVFEVTTFNPSLRRGLWISPCVVFEDFFCLSNGVDSNQFGVLEVKMEHFKVDHLRC